MRRLWLVVLMLLVPTLLVGFIVGTNSRNQPPEIASTTLSAYIRLPNKHLSPSQIRIVRSRLPNQFTQQMSLTTYSEGWYYQSDHVLKNAPQRSQTSSDATALGQFKTARALIYPPVETWCIFVSTDTEISLVLAQHQDLYNAEWVVHELSADAEQRAKIHTEIGCG